MKTTELPKSTRNNYKKAIEYREKGLTYGQIAQQLGYTHPESIRNLLKVGDKYFKIL